MGPAGNTEMSVTSYQPTQLNFPPKKKKGPDMMITEGNGKDKEGSGRDLV
jgi:hypothetical protein